MQQSGATIAKVRARLVWGQMLTQREGGFSSVPWGVGIGRVCYFSPVPFNLCYSIRVIRCKYVLLIYIFPLCH